MAPRTDSDALPQRLKGAVFPEMAQLEEAGQLRSQILFIYGTTLAIGLHLALIWLSLFRSVPETLYIIFGSFVWGTANLGLWKWVLPRFAFYPMGWRVAAQFAASVLAFTLLSVLMVELRPLVVPNAPSFLQPYSGGPRTITITAEAIGRAPLLYALVPILPVAMLCVVGFNQHFWRIFLMKGRQVALEELAVSAQLAALRAQINPHFLFNSLNSIAQLIHSDPSKAEACVERLGEIYRYLLHRAHSDFAPLADELRVVEAYLEIERARFGENLEVESRIDERARALLLPSLILQPLVENAVKHGISPKLGGGRVTIEARLDDGDLRLAVSDTGVGVTERGGSVFERGVGLRNVRERLIHLYGDDYAPQLRSDPHRGTTVSLRIPIALGSA
jgi:signal transduction histidine kinase